jgi:hypothetical protein
MGRRMTVTYAARQLYMEAVSDDCGKKASEVHGQSNENGSPHITHMARKLITLKVVYGMNILWGLGEAQ